MDTDPAVNLVQKKGLETLDAIKRGLLVLQIATVLLFIALAGLAVKTYSDANNNKDALCALRGDLERRVASSEEFLRDHPKGIAGFPAATIKQGIANQKSTIDALSNIDC